MKKIFIEADSIVSEKMSGIGHATLEIARGFDKICEHDPKLKVTLIVPYEKSNLLSKYGFKKLSVRRLPPGQKYVNYLLTRTSVPVPVDLIFGRGIYIFPNYKSWYVPFSSSITFVHDVAFKIFPEATNAKNLAYLEVNFDRWMKRATKIISITEASSNDFKKFYPRYKNKVEVVHLGVDPDFYYRRTPEEVSTVQKKYKLPQDYFLYVGNIEPRKNISVMLDAYKLYCDGADQPKTLVLIGGDGWKNDDIRHKITELQQGGYNVYRPDGYVPDEALPAIYTGASVVIHVALHEGFGLPPLQAQACETFVISSNIPALKEILDPNLAEFVDQTQPRAIAASMLRSHDKLANIKKTSFTWDNCVMHLSAIIDKMSSKS